MNKPRKPWIAVILTLITRGLGHLYAGNLKRGLILFFIEACLLIAFAVLALMVATNLTFLVFAGIGSIAYVVFCAVDAALIARRRKEIYELTSYNKWYVYAGYFVVFSVLVSSLISSGVKAYITQAYKIPSGAMMPTLLIGDHLLVNKFIYGVGIPFIDINKPERGDVIVFIYPEDESKDYIKRVIGLPGDTISIVNKQIFLNGEKYQDEFGVYNDPKILHPGQFNSNRDNIGPITVPPDSLFVMGDNRDHSADSRFWGFVNINKVRGKAVSLYWSWDHDQRTVRWDRIGKPIQ